jgi:hypothetical protein
VIKSPLGLQTVTDGLTSILGVLCNITVNVVDTVVAPVPVVGAPAAGAVNSAVSGVTGGVAKALPGAAQSSPGKAQPAPQNPATGSPQTGPGATNPAAGSATIPAPTSPVLGGDPASFGLLPLGSSGFAPMRNYSDIPYALAGLWAPAPGLRYGGQIPGYSPDIGSLGQGSGQGKAVQNAGQAEALPGGGSGAPDPVGLPMLIAVLTLSGVSAALVRAWVLRGATA